MTRFWYWFIPGLAVALAVFSIYTVLGAFVFPDVGMIPSIQFLMCGLFFFPVLLIVFAVGQVMLRRRRPMSVTVLERVLMVVSALFPVALVATSFDIEALLFGGILWPFTLAAAVTLVVAIVLTNRRLARESLMDRGEADGSSPQISGDATDLFGAPSE